MPNIIHIKPKVCAKNSNNEITQFQIDRLVALINRCDVFLDLLYMKDTPLMLSLGCTVGTRPECIYREERITKS